MTYSLKKLEFYDIRGIARTCFTSYLTNCQRIVSMNQITSIPVNISCRVSQGSVLGPILFLLYINDFHSFPDFFGFHLFADDTNLFSEHKSLSSLQATVEPQ